ncbi:hypothetical protein [Natronosalvus vescus]|uniref:hypothetical protein n=1 Tax=Natronosalvus vescus TaxID=2953881 RepID=UPI002090A4EB|nr:hypothetical protein [Natronosalvus vescus]
MVGDRPVVGSTLVVVQMVVVVVVQMVVVVLVMLVGYRVGFDCVSLSRVDRMVIRLPTLKKYDYINIMDIII